MSQVTTNEPTVADAAPASTGLTCEACGAPLDADDSFCTACGTPHEVTIATAGSQIVDAEVIAAEAEEEIAAQKHFRCNNCGAEVATSPETRSYTCPFCDSTYVVEFPAGENPRQPPEFVIGFSITEEKARELFREWMHDNAWYRPGDLTMARITDKLRGIYLPFWSFSMLAESRWSAGIGEYWYKTETYTTMQNGKMVTKTRRVRHTEWWNLAGRHHRYYSGYLVSGSHGLPQEQADRIKPFHLPALKRYKPYFLAGWLNEEYTVQRDEAIERCRQEFHLWEQRNVAGFMPGDTHRDLQVQTSFSKDNSDLILLPIYLLSYHYQGKLYRFLVNGQTGKIAGDKPISWRRIWAAIGSGVAALLIFLLILFLLGALGAG